MSESDRPDRPHPPPMKVGEPSSVIVMVVVGFMMMMVSWKQQDQLVNHSFPFSTGISGGPFQRLKKKFTSCQRSQRRSASLCRCGCSGGSSPRGSTGGSARGSTENTSASSSSNLRMTSKMASRSSRSDRRNDGSAKRLSVVPSRFLADHVALPPRDFISETTKMANKRVSSLLGLNY